MVDGGAAALEACERAETLGKRFPLILLDARMPGIDGFEVAQRFKQRDPGGATKIVMLTSAGVGDDAARCREIGIDAYLNKPVGRADLLETIKVVLGGRSARDAKLSLNPRNLAIGPHQALHVLLAEDNAVNQTLAIRLLEKRGHTVMVAGTGTAALELLNTQEFDVILMDIQMPEIDGLSATAAIRERERRRGGHIPIIAMTANAMVGDKETYLASGMDGYVSKPINAQELFALIEALPAYPKFDLR
jgi:CheY-like chemotaxis protein